MEEQIDGSTPVIGYIFLNFIPDTIPKIYLFSKKKFSYDPYKSSKTTGQRFESQCKPSFYLHFIPKPTYLRNEQKNFVTSPNPLICISRKLSNQSKPPNLEVSLRCDCLTFNVFHIRLKLFKKGQALYAKSSKEGICNTWSNFSHYSEP